jgi:phosphoglycerate dehydrogenase-like enzyme
VAKLANGFDMNIRGWNRTPKEFPDYIDYESKLEKVLKSSDFIALCLANNSETTGMFDYELLSKTKKGVIIINHAAHDVVDWKDLRKLLDEKHIAGYSAVYYDLEDHGLTDYKQVSALPHHAWNTDHSRKRMKEIWVGNIVNAIKKDEYPHRVVVVE